MIAAVVGLIVAVASPTAGPSPGPAATPLKEIGHVRTSLLCTTLRDDLFPAVSGLRTNDAVIDQGNTMLGKMAYDSVAGKLRARSGGKGASGTNHGLQLDDYQLGLLVQAIAQNLDKIEKLLADPKRFPPDPKADDVQLLDTAKAHLEAVADQQRAALNILSGTVETTALQSLLAKGDNTAGALGPASHSDIEVNLQTNPLDVNAQQQSSNSAGSPSAAATVPPYMPATNAAQTSTYANNSWGRLALGAVAQQTVTAQAETGVLPAVLPIVNICK